MSDNIPQWVTLPSKKFGNVSGASDTLSNPENCQTCASNQFQGALKSFKTFKK